MRESYKLCAGPLMFTDFLKIQSVYKNPSLEQLINMKLDDAYDEYRAFVKLKRKT